jgi:hypothetical protein
MPGKNLDFLKTALNHQIFIHNSLDSKASWLLGISGVLFVLSLSHLDLPVFKWIAVFSLLSALFNIWAISFPFKYERRQGFSFLCWKGFRRLNFVEYQKEADAIIGDEQRMIIEYEKEIHSLSEHSIKPKSRLIRWGSVCLTISFIAGFVGVLGRVWFG